ncbi:MAG: peptidylprolyl isomerase, partial [Gammaproteobacteria bacterium]|nr:peptidylprolyl isomerase [Gammaproteobacteria bacterium]
QFKQQVALDIVTQVLVHREAERQGLQPDRETIASEIEAHDAKYRNSPEWQAQRERILPQLALRMERQNLLERMEAQIRRLPEPAGERVVAFYERNPDKFTEPARLWGSVILLPVPPSAGEAAWSEAETRALQLKFRIANGEDFATLAQQHSGHPSAVNGGDLGYLHQGVLEQSVQQRVDALEIDEISDPIRVLEGILLFRLNGVQPPQLKPFADVQQRAAGLLYRDMQDQAWENYLRELKASADIYVNENLYVQSNHE